MNIKQLFAFFALFLFPYLMQAQDPKVIELEVEDPRELGAKSLPPMPSVILYGTELNFQYPFAMESQVVIVDQSTQTIVFSETFASALSVVIDLEDEGLGEGTYTLHVYAFGKWWWGEFEILDYNL